MKKAGNHLEVVFYAVILLSYELFIFVAGTLVFTVLFKEQNT